MANWKSKVFGDTRFNFYGSIVGGIVILTLSTREVILAVLAKSGNAIVHHLLLAIWILLMGQFAVSMQNYCARVAKKLDEQDLK